MGNTPSCLDEQLKPIYNASKPPWINRFGQKEYTGRPDWWTERGQVDLVTRDKKMVNIGSRFLEEDPSYYDPKVPDGTSLAGPFGLDSHYNPDLTKKGDQVGNFFDFTKKVMKGSAQYRQIAEKYELSKEHPGINVSPVMDQINHTPYNQLGKSHYGNSWHHFGPRFWDKPINEGCFEKGLWAIKSVALFALPITLFSLKGRPPADTHEKMLRIWGYKAFGKRYLSLLPLPMTIATAYTVSLCTSANIRRKDDWFNYLIASGVFGFTLASIKDNITVGVIAVLISLLGGTFVHYARVDPRGLQGRILHQMTASFWTGPLTWKNLNLGEMEVPKRNF